CITVTFDRYWSAKWPSKRPWLREFEKGQRTIAVLARVSSRGGGIRRQPESLHSSRAEVGPRQDAVFRQTRSILTSAPVSPGTGPAVGKKMRTRLRERRPGASKLATHKRVSEVDKGRQTLRI